MQVKQIANLLDLLEHFAQTQEPAALAEISATQGWPRSSTFNILSTLVQRGYLYEPRGRGEFYPTTRWLSLAQSIHEKDRLPEALCSAADTISRKTDETAAIVAPAGLNAVCLYVAESTAAIRFSANPGFQVPLHASAAGRALLAQYSPRERAPLLKKISYEKYRRTTPTPMTPSETEAKVKQEMAQGWHQSAGEGDDLVGIAFPVPQLGRPLAIVVGGPATRIQRNVAAILETMRQVMDSQKR